MIKIILICALLSVSTLAISADLYDQQSGKYLGHLGGSQYDPNSTNNLYGRYGSKYSNQSPNNPYATQPPVIVQPNIQPYGYGR